MLCVTATNRAHLWLPLASMPFIALVVLRGMVGTDSLIYEQTIDLIRRADTYTFTFEPAFEYLALWLARIFDNSLIVIKLIAVITTILLISLGSSNNAVAAFIGLGVLPYFYLDMTMNGLRYGLAFSLISYSIKYIVQGRVGLFWILVCAASAVQISSLLLAMLVYFLINFNWRRLFIAIFVAFICYYVAGEYIALKSSAHSQLQTSSLFSGIAPLLMSITIWFAAYTIRFVRQKYFFQLLVLLSIIFGAYLLTYFTYSGLRFQQLVLFGIYTFFLSIFIGSNRKLPKAFFIALSINCILGAGFRLKNFADDFGNGDAPFAPYQFF